MPLDELFTGSEIDTSLFYPSAWEQVQVDGQVYGLPQFIDVRALYVNLNALAEIGQDPTLLNTGDWDQLAQLGAQLVARDGDTIQRWGFDHKIQADWLWLWAIGNGGSMMSDDGQEITFDDPKVVDALQWGVDAYAAQGGFASYEATAAAWQADEQFPRGQVAMTMYENWLLGIIARIAPNLNFRVTPITHRGGAEPVSYTGGNAWTIPNGAADPVAAWTFIEFMARPETWMLGATAVRDARVAEGAPFIPSLTANSAVDQQQIEELYVSLGGPFDEAVQLFPSLLAASISLPLGKSTAATQIAEALRDEGILPALRGELSAEEALRQADQSAEASAAAE
jgi:multiple sugar transport system substrate-binding protein